MDESGVSLDNHTVYTAVPLLLFVTSLSSDPKGILQNHLRNHSLCL